MYCSKCGSPYAADARFCATCGTARDLSQPPSNTYASGSAGNSVSPPSSSQQYILGSAAPQAVPPPPYYADPRAVAAVPQMAPQMPSPVPPPVYYSDPRIRGGAPILVSPNIRPYAVGKSAVVAVLLSFLIPGVGQFYCGAGAKGGLMLALGIVSWVLIPLYGFGVLCLIGTRIWSMIDAYNIASGKIPLS